MTGIRFGRHVLGGFDGTEVTREVRELILKDRILGFTLFKWNITDAGQLRALTEELKSLAREAGYEIVLAVDQEGGRVERLPEPFNRIPAMRRWGGGAGFEPDKFKALGRLIGDEVRLAGFNLDFAPVADVDVNPSNPVIGDRAFSADPEVVTNCCRGVLAGFAEAGVAGCLKHFPGHGATTRDSHEELPVDARPLALLEANDLVPYRGLVAEGIVPAVMTAHVLYPGVDPDNVATLSPAFLDGILRRRFGFDGVIFSDDLLMKAVSDRFDPAGAALRFFLAGGDAVLVCKRAEESRELIARLEAESAASGGLALHDRLRKASARIDALERRLRSFPAPTPEDLSGMVARHAAFVRGVFPA